MKKAFDLGSGSRVETADSSPSVGGGVSFRLLTAGTLPIFQCVVGKESKIVVEVLESGPHRPEKFRRPKSFPRRKTSPLKSSRTSNSAQHQTSQLQDKMRPLTEVETKTLFEKLAAYTGNSLKNLIAPLDNGPNADRNVFRVHQSRCYFVRLSLANLATSISRDKLLSLGTCLGMTCPIFS